MANTTETKATEKKETKNTVKMVKIRLPRSRKDEGDVTVGVNGTMYRIKRGVEVEVPDFVAEVLTNSEATLEKAYAYQDSVQKN